MYSIDVRTECGDENDRWNQNFYNLHFLCALVCHICCSPSMERKHIKQRSNICTSKETRGKCPSLWVTDKMLFNLQAMYWSDKSQDIILSNRFTNFRIKLQCCNMALNYRSSVLPLNNLHTHNREGVGGGIIHHDKLDNSLTSRNPHLCRRNVNKIM